MNRKDFLKKSGCGMLYLSTMPLFMQSASAKGVSEKEKHYKIDIEIFEAPENSFCHQKGTSYEYPADIGKMCPWLLASMHDFIRLLENGVTLNWKYEGTPYEKKLNENGVTTEYLRCPDPTTSVVAKIIRTEVEE